LRLGNTSEKLRRLGRSEQVGANDDTPRLVGRDDDHEGCLAFAAAPENDSRSFTFVPRNEGFSVEVAEVVGEGSGGNAASRFEVPERRGSWFSDVKEGRGFPRPSFGLL
jgi:hypothetical protein